MNTCHKFIVIMSFYAFYLAPKSSYQISRFTTRECGKDKQTTRHRLMYVTTIHVSHCL